jgi:flagellar basal-body rod protein FlgB
MFDKIDVMRMAQGLARHAGARQQAVAENVANLDTPGYKRKGIPDFADLHADVAARDRFGDRLKATRPGHLGVHGGTLTPYTPPEPAVLRDQSETPNGNAVSMEKEIVSAAEVRQQHDMALTVYQSAINILRTGIGRR